MNTAILIYLYLTITKIAEYGALICGMIAFGTVLFSVLLLDDQMIDEKIKKTINKVSKITTVLFFICLFVAVLIPSKKDLTWIIGGATAYSVVSDNKAELEKLPKNILNVTNDFLEGLQDEKPKQDKKIINK